MGSGRIGMEVDQGVATLTMTRADKLNAMDGAMFAAIGDGFRSLGRDPTVRAILLAGEGRHFTAGLDLEYAAGQFAPGSDPGRAAESRLRHIRDGGIVDGRERGVGHLRSIRAGSMAKASSNFPLRASKV